MSAVPLVPSRSARARSRRRFIELAGAAGAAAFVSTGLNLVVSRAPSLFAAGGNVEALVLNCFDFRLVNEVGFLLGEHGLTNRYDQVVLAGATLGIGTDRYPAWAQTFWEHLQLAIELHGIKRVIAIDHRDCGAYRVTYNKDFVKSPDEETAIHTKVMTEFRDQVKRKQPSLEVELLLMHLDGHVQPIGEGIVVPDSGRGH
ncbi:MAG: twin-arginine translocation signal domain-containing protein [Chloroflexi bacterium]|nr:twin-arginine translocation signal domain-containing protein [Chloroflexota bacterium]